MAAGSATGAKVASSAAHAAAGSTSRLRALAELWPSDSEAARERLPTPVVVPGGRHAVSGGGGGGSGTERFGRDAVVGEG